MADKISGNRRVTLAADKGYDTRECVRKLRDRNITPHVAQNDTNRRSAIDRRTTRHPGYQVSQRKRKLVEQMFGWAKTVGLMRKTRHRGTERVDWMFTFTAAAFNSGGAPKVLFFQQFVGTVRPIVASKRLSRLLKNGLGAPFWAGSSRSR